MTGFGSSLATAWERFGRLCVGIDPHDALLDEWGLPRNAVGVSEFGLRVVEAAAGRVGVVKPQVAFFERFGSAGFAALEQVIAAARRAGLLVIADAKRGDVGSTMAGYAQAWLEPGSPLEADAVTLNPYQGVGSLAPAIELASRTGKGVFLLAATSNPEGVRQQQARLDDADGGSTTVAAHIVAEVDALNRAGGPTDVGSLGVVIGATLDLQPFGIPAPGGPVLPVLAPGFGAQGATLDGAAERFGALAPGLIVAESRGVLGGDPALLSARIDARAEEVRHVRVR
ncbi:orotidine-5'-phosphate decarboxylase [Mycetocola reblochoni]|uniref:Orotidine-5'-phosphate decarboxylase n=2 Tax=Mycetocola reblochoni TaxID=331618 RepID=A0A1R4J415_9MICO|nr:orotidine-5'-phosphate decarboxylase [Mycetocola reblochoni]RLP69516.1 orotidine-5'-phosphate decarboxylase [Mycetocola reblochoni]SJN26778.1 Orotidine 5'-phosphate decarboxylase [Mycetocola reblochoni REB411]